MDIKTKQYQIYKKQVSLLLNVIPEINKFPELALHGGTAINLFLLDMPRLSVDIDLTYLPIEPRDLSLSKITKILEQIEILKIFFSAYLTLVKTYYKILKCLAK